MLRMNIKRILANVRPTRLIRGLYRGYTRHNKCQTHSDYVMYDRQPGYRCTAAHRLITGSVARRNNAKEFNLAPINCRRYGKSDTAMVTWLGWNRNRGIVDLVV